MDKVKLRWRFLRRKLLINIATNREISERAVRESIKRISTTAPHLAIATMLVALSFLLFVNPATDTEQTWRNGIIFVNSLSSIGCVFSALISRRAIKKKYSLRFMNNFLNLVIAFVLISGLAITMIDQSVMTNLTPMMISITIVSTLYFQRPLRGIITFLVVYILFFLGMILLNVSPHILSSSLVNGMVITFVGCALTIVNWANFRRSELQERKILEQQAVLERMAYHDPLTKLPNRRFLDELIKNEVAKVRRGQTHSCLIVLDIDDFKLVNDTYGHPTGDEVLKEFVEVVDKLMRASDTFVRLGGEEFLILVPDSSLDATLIFADRLRQEVARHRFTANDDKITITISIGVASLNGVETSSDYYSNADRALYRAKNKGKNRIEVHREIS